MEDGKTATEGFDAFWSSVKDRMIHKDEGMAFRFFKAFEGDAALSESKLLEADMKRPLNTPSVKLNPEQQAFLEASVVANIIGSTSEGEPILYIKVLQTDLTKFRELFEPKLCNKMIKSFMEYCVRDLLPSAASVAKKKVYHLGIVVDLEGLNLSSVITNPGMLAFAKEYASIVGDGYPEMANKILVYNAGKLASAAFTVFSPIFPDRMTKMVKFHSGKPPEDQLTFIPHEIRFKEFGGDFEGGALDLPTPSWVKPSFFFVRVNPPPKGLTIKKEEEKAE